MRARAAVEVDIPANAGARLRSALVRMQIDFLVFERAPEAFDKDAVPPAALAVHAELNSMLLANQLDKIPIGELRALIRVEYLWPAVPRDSLLNRFDAEVGRKRVRKAPGQHAPRCPVNNRKEIQEARRIGMYEMSAAQT